MARTTIGRIRCTLCRMLPLMVASAACAGVQAADQDGRFHGMGAGLATCGKYLDVRAAGGKEYFLFGGWIAGYLSARNQVDADTYSLAPWQSADVLAGFLADYCSRNRDEIFLRAMIVMTESLEAERLTRRSERVTVTVGARSVDLFQATIERMQRRLAALGYETGTENGHFTARTQEAVGRFQADHSLEASGFPDPLTLFRLFRD